MSKTLETTPVFGERFDWKPKRGWRLTGVLRSGRVCMIPVDYDRRKGVQFTKEMIGAENRNNDLLEHLFERMAKRGLSVDEMGQRLGVEPELALSWIEKFNWTDSLK